MKIDVAKIDGYEEMSPEEKLKALTEYDFPVPDTSSEIEKLKTALSKANSQASEWKRQYRETQTEQERAAAEREEADKRKDELIAQYEAKERVSNYTKKFVEAGYDFDTASVMAAALPAGVSDEYFAASKSYIETKTKEIETAALQGQKGLSVGNPPPAKTDEDRIADIAMKAAGLI